MIELASVCTLLDRANAMVYDLDGLDLTDTEDGKEKAGMRSHKAEVSRSLLELADVFAMIECVVRNEYWQMKGRGVFIEIAEFND